MLNIIVVEDDNQYQHQIKSIIRTNMFKYDSTYNILFFNKMTNELKKVIDDDSYQKIYVLDIELTNSISGIEIGKLIRNHDWESHIIYLTSHDYQFQKVFTSILEVFAFIEKFDNMEEKLAKAINDIASQKCDNKMLKIESRNTNINIFYKAITYISRDKEDRKLIIHTTNNCFTTSLTLQEIKKLLDQRFCFAHRACIINKERVQQYNWTKGFFILDTGEEVLYLSKKYKSEVISK